MKCWINPKWECYIEAEEVPLEACKLCIETRLKLIMIKRRMEVEELSE